MTSRVAVDDTGSPAATGQAPENKLCGGRAFPSLAPPPKQRPYCGRPEPRPGRAAHAGPQQWPSCLGSVLCPSRGALATFHSHPAASPSPGDSGCSPSARDGGSQTGARCEGEAFVLKDSWTSLKTGVTLPREVSTFSFHLQMSSFIKDSSSCYS